MSESWREAKLLITLGAGGVGKTSTAAALALAAAVEGKRVAVLTIDPARRLAQTLGLEQLTGVLRQVSWEQLERRGSLGRPKGELWAMMLDPQHSADQMVRRFSRSPAQATEILNHDYYHYFSTALPGAQEYMAVESLHRILQEEEFDLLVLDTPPATQALDFLDAPERMMRTLESKGMGMMRRKEGGQLNGLLMRGFQRLTGGGFFESLLSFLALFGEILDALQISSTAIKRLLKSPDTRFLLISSPRRSRLEEAINLYGILKERGLSFGGFICNRVHRRLSCDLAEMRARFQEQGGELLSEREREGLWAAMWESLKRHNQMAKEEQAICLRLKQVAAEPPMKIPLLPQELHSLDDLLLLSRSLSEREPT